MQFKPVIRRKSRMRVFDEDKHSIPTLQKLLRIDVAPESDYKVPADNPFVGDRDARPEIWVYGLKKGKPTDYKDHNKDLQPKDGGIDLISSFAEDIEWQHIHR